MKPSTKAILATSLIGKLLLGALIASAAIESSQVNPTISQRVNASQIAELSDGDGEMNDALEARQEKPTLQKNVPTEANNIDRTQKISEDNDGGDETREIPNEPHDTDGGDETQETH